MSDNRLRMTTRIAIVRIPLDALREVQAVQDAGEGWSSFTSGDTRIEIQARGAALLVRFEGDASGLAVHFGAAWQHHEEPRGIAVHSEVPSGDDYESLVEGASWEGGNLFAQVAAMFGGGAAKAEPEPAEAQEGGQADGEAGEGEGSPFDGIGESLMSAVAKRSSRKVLAARLAADRGEKDLGDILDAMDAPEAEGDEAITKTLDQRFAFDPEHSEMAKLIGRSLDGEIELANEGDGSESPEAGEPGEPEPDPETKP